MPSRRRLPYDDDITRPIRMIDSHLLHSIQGMRFFTLLLVAFGLIGSAVSATADYFLDPGPWPVLLGVLLLAALALAGHWLMALRLRHGFYRQVRRLQAQGLGVYRIANTGLFQGSLHVGREPPDENRRITRYLADEPLALDALYVLHRRAAQGVRRPHAPG